jgi:hypothetical protein
MNATREYVVVAWAAGELVGTSPAALGGNYQNTIAHRFEICQI